MFESRVIADRVDAIAQDLAALIDLLGSDAAVAPQSADAIADGIATVESVGRLMDCARVRVLARLIADPLVAEQLGHASPSAAVASIAGISERSARTRLAVAGATGTCRAITGEVLAASRPAVSAALDAGHLGLDAANLIVTELRSIAGRTPAAVLDVAESVMVGLATGVSATGEHMATSVSAISVSVDFLAGEVRQVTAAADPDGARPREERATRRRDFRLGTVDDDGLVTASGRLLPEIGSLLAGMLEAYRRSPRFVGTETSLIDANDLALGIDPRTIDPRTPGQRRHDALGEILLAAAATEGSPRLDGQAVTVLVTVNAADLADEDGRDSDAIGVMSGSSFLVSRRTIERFIDAGGYRVATKDDGGVVTAISSPQRCFTPMQRLGMVARDGLGCVTPGCSSPHYTLQAHHVIPDRDGGPTALDNGLLLCYWHHQQVDTGPWRYRMIEGLPYVRGPGVPHWTPARKPIARVA